MIKNKVEITLEFVDYITLGKVLEESAQSALCGAVHYANKRNYKDEFDRSHFWENFHKYDALQKLRGVFGFDTTRNYEDEQLFRACSDYLNACIDSDVEDTE